MCAFRLLPDPDDGPISVGAGQPSAPLVFAELAGGNPLRMFIRVVRVSRGGALAGGADPTFTLRASRGGPIELPLMTVDAQAVSVVDGNRNVVAEAGYTRDVMDVFLLTVDVFFPGSDWSLEIRNNHDESRQFVAVVGDNDGDTDGARQPWINVPASLAFSARAGVTEAFQQTLTVTNLGSGTLTLRPGGVADPFRAIAPQPIAPNSVGKMSVVCTPGAIDTARQTLTVASNDSAAHASAGHNNVVAVTFARVAEPEPNPDPDPPDSSCRVPGCGCPGYRQGFQGRCGTPGCGHAYGSHNIPR